MSKKLLEKLIVTCRNGRNNIVYSDRFADYGYKDERTFIRAMEKLRLDRKIECGIHVPYKVRRTAFFGITIL